MTDGGERPDDEAGDAAEWPVALRGITESLVTTLGPNRRWNAAALGLHAPEGDDGRAADDPVAAITYGNTRTRRNFHRRGEGYVQFATDPELFVEAALGIHEVGDPILPSADAWVRVTAERVAVEEGEGIRKERWHLRPVECAVVRRTVPTTNRGYAAVIEATVAASRLDADAYDADALRDRLRHLESVVDTCGGAAERRAFDRVNDLTGWKQNESF